MNYYSSRSFLLYFCFLFVCLSSCSEDDYISPLSQIKIDDMEFDSVKDSCSISYNDVNFTNVVFYPKASWCEVSANDNTIKIKVLTNYSQENREVIVKALDTNNKAILKFVVKQKYNYNAIYNYVRINSFKLCQEKREFIPFLISEKEIHISIPKDVNLNNVSVLLSHVGDSAFIDSMLVDENGYDFSDFTIPHKLRIKSLRGVDYSWDIKLYDLPVITINTPDSMPILSKEKRKEDCAITLISANSEIEDLGAAGIKGRGNSTWGEPKKPYNIKLAKKRSVLGMKKSKHWILLANAKYDRSQLHNDVAYEIARKTDYPWVQSGRFVELIINGVHQGLYYICEKIRIESGKIEIAEILPADTIGDALTGGYMLEANINKKADTSFSTDYFNCTGGNYPIYWDFVKPEGTIPIKQRYYIYNELNNLESLIANDSTLFNGEYRKYLDIESAINWWMVETLCVNEEASRTKNLIIYKDRDSYGERGKFYVGPPWDFDAWTFVDRGFHYLPVNTATWCYRQLLRDPFFINRLKEKWLLYYDLWKNEIPKYINSQYELLYRSAKRNDIMWPDWPYSPDSWEKSVDEMRVAFMIQLEWMNEYINNL